MRNAGHSWDLLGCVPLRSTFLAHRDAGGPGSDQQAGAFPYVDQYVPLRWRVVMAPTKKRPPYPRGCDGADKPEHNLVHHCFASERRRHSASLQALGTIRCRPPTGRGPALARVGGLGPALRAWSLAWERQATFSGRDRAARCPTRKISPTRVMQLGRRVPPLSTKRTSGLR
jgi:hypothetical protein